MEHFLAVECVFDPFGAGVDVCCGACDDWFGGEDRGDVVEDWVGAFAGAGGGVGDDGLVEGAGGVLEGVEDFGELEGEEAL